MNHDRADSSVQVRLSAGEVLAVFEARAPQYRAVPGLVQKIYLSFPDTGEHGAVYLRETAQAMQALRASALARSIPQAYQIQGDLAIDSGQVELVLREARTASARTAPLASGQQI